MNRWGLKTFIRSTPPRAVDESGAISVLTVLMIPLFFVLAGIGFDFSNLNAQRKHVQSQADLSALSGVLNLNGVASVRESAREAANVNDYYVAQTLRDDQIILGNVDHITHLFTPNEDQDTIENVSAVAVNVESVADFHILSQLLGMNSAVVSRRAVAEAMPEVSFALSNCLLSMNLFAGILDPILGVDADVLCSGSGLRIDMIQLLDEIALSGDVLTPDNPSYSDILDADMNYSDLLEMIFDTAIPDMGGTVQLGEILQVNDKMRNARVGSPIPPVEINAADLVFGGLEILGENMVNLETQINLGSFTGVGAKLTITEPRKVIVGARPGDPDAVASTAQIKLEVDDLNIAGIFKLSLAANLANATARLSKDGEHCSEAPLLRAAVFDPVEATLLDLELELEVLNLPILSLVDPFRTSSLVETTTQTVEFTHNEVAAGTVKTFGPQSNVELIDLNQDIRDLTSVMLTSVRDAVDVDSAGCAGLLGCLIHPVLDGLSTTLSLSIGHVTNAISAEGELLNAVLEDFLGLGIAKADLEVLDVSCSVRLAG
ncbi:hypothetical protein BFP76_00025 [Amylibacter kogurei]|uniref:Putative Flp pilus-assembly TadG-like N-terminal domain-containing protein n=1 Tax=Paramylibacter kogurei TaxID=1889778 RepID=A0A2G5K9K1_9RHOB|nr:pilus assembly protein TadG-related protein [Amylibacter kogurei]PIB25570.1 hypothetical protein BFP76_00025 [Amylibacter kogurei]